MGPSFTFCFRHHLHLTSGAGLWVVAQSLAPSSPFYWPPLCPSSAAEWTESGERWTYLKETYSADTVVYFEVNGTFVLGLGISGLRTGPLLGFAADPLSGLNFLFDVMLSRMFATRGCPDEAEGFPEP